MESTATSENCVTFDEILKTARGFKARYGSQPSGYKMSRATMDMLSRDILLYPLSAASTSIYDVPVFFDETVPLGKFRIVTSQNLKPTISIGFLNAYANSLNTRTRPTDIL